MHTCGEGHETMIVESGGEEIILVHDQNTGECLYTIKGEDFEIQDMKERLNNGECPVCDDWEYLP